MRSSSGSARWSAYTQDRAQRRWPRALNVIGLLGCGVLVVTLPLGAVLAGLLMFAIGLLGRALILRRVRGARSVTNP